MPIYRYTGLPALSTFRTQKLLQHVQSAFPAVESISATYVYFAESAESLSDKAQTKLMDVLQAEKWDAFSFDNPDPEYEYPQEVTALSSDSTHTPLNLPVDNTLLILVVPRLGTISPWSSKATDIVHQAGLEKVQRVERGVVYMIKQFPSTGARHPVCISSRDPAKLREEVREGDFALASTLKKISDFLYDPMTESVLFDPRLIDTLFTHPSPTPATEIDILSHGKAALLSANQALGLALTAEEVDYLLQAFRKLKKNPTDCELMMFAQVNSEHCRHKIFNADWIIDGKPQEYSLFQMIKNTYKENPEGVLSAYKDNGAVLSGSQVNRFFINPQTKSYYYHHEAIATVIKVETHNHPTAIAPFAGAATGAGGEIRDEGAVGRGAVPKAGLTGFSVSNLQIPEFNQPWETPYGKPENIASALDIMLEAPIGSAAFNNEFGRPNICGYFRTYEVAMRNPHGAMRGYHKPIMIAGGLGNIRPTQVEKKEIPAGAKLIVLGGPAMLIGMGGGAASSMASGAQEESLDFASVQRGNAEMERRCQEVINTCWTMGDANPILSIHDVGAGGLSNALPELIEASERGGALQLRDIPSAESGLSPMEIWCNEAQERYVLAIQPENLAIFTAIAERERCPFAVVGEATTDQDLILKDSHFENAPVDLPMSVLFGDSPKLVKKVVHDDIAPVHFGIEKIDLMEAATRVLQLPCVADKSFLITIGDRSVTGMIARDQMVGPWQVPVADVAVTANSFDGYTGEAMAMGERAPIALLHHVASARMAVGEAITNIAASYIEKISDIKLSANWMAASGYPGEDAGLYDAVQAIGMELCPALGICIPVGKDSLSMRTLWEENGKKCSVTAPMSVVISAFAPVIDIRKTLTPELQKDVYPSDLNELGRRRHDESLEHIHSYVRTTNHVENNPRTSKAMGIGETDLILINLGDGSFGLGGSALAQVYQQQGKLPPDVDEPEKLKQFFNAIQTLNRDDLILAYHDRSDGGLFVTLCEMAFAAHVGLDINLDTLGNAYPIEILFSEELGAVIQVRRTDTARVVECLKSHDLEKYSHVIGTLNDQDTLVFSYHNNIVLQASRVHFQQLWSETSFRMQALRDNPDCAQQAFDQIGDTKDPGLNVNLTFDLAEDISAPYLKLNTKPKVAILREEGVNGYMEMAAAFTRAGFEAVDVHMTDILEGRIALHEFRGLAACGGFSYGDVLGAGRGWAQSILNHTRAQDEFGAFFLRQETFTLGICNGCQMLSQLKSFIPGSEHWPVFLRNQSEQFEARFSLVEIQATPSIFFQGMAGSRIGVAIAHGEGRATFESENTANQAPKNALYPLDLKELGRRQCDLYPEHIHSYVRTTNRVENDPRTSKTAGIVVARYVDNDGKSTMQYPANPNGSSQAIAGLTSRDGRATILMPHPERVFRTVQNSWHPKDWQEDAPTMRMFRNARVWVG